MDVEIITLPSDTQALDMWSARLLRARETMIRRRHVSWAIRKYHPDDAIKLIHSYDAHYKQLVREYSRGL